MIRNIIYLFEQFIYDICSCGICNKSLFTEIEPDEFSFLIS